MRAIVVKLIKRGEGERESYESLFEMSSLVRAIGGKYLGFVIQKRAEEDPRYYLGKGKIRQVKEIVKGVNADSVVFDTNLSPSQLRHIEDELGVRVFDRTDIVLEIFSERIKSKEAKLQVELAKLLYQLPRLYGKGKELSRLGGGVGTRGPGEKELEKRRRIIKERIKKIKRELEELRKVKREQRKRRENIFKVALVGYTNAGKSTLLKSLTGKDVFIANIPFATLDTRTSLRYLNGKKVVITDTVGFIRNLPPQLIESFKTTLEEVTLSDLLLVVLDAKDRDYLKKLEVIERTLEEIGANQKPKIYVFNKIDLLTEEELQVLKLEVRALKHPVVFVSAKDKRNLKELLLQIEAFLYNR